ncbi:LacI family DNA-binding transcriptional regulator [Eubacterium xylanophilum]|uniref:LacI family DNA-binding transcriptional regulator n=1 Tax=Eubacterium xylanophilum TaxID=39497 RepID=UPI00047B04C5|nr:LacI family DNA-binding transcriptional regulator [Eubacterium xylanophilum]
MVSLKDISSECGVSVATVSKALNNRGDISEATKERVCEVAKRLGYLPNSSARALKTKHTYNLGVLFVDQANCGLTHAYFSHVLDSFKRGAEREGYDITFITQRTGKSTLSYYEHSKYRGVDGVVIACVDFTDEAIIELANSDIPVVTIDYTFPNRTSILSDNRSGMRKIIDFVVRKGHRDIAFIHAADSFVAQERLKTFYGAMEEAHIPIREELVREGVFHDPVNSAQITNELLALDNRPTCIIYPDDFSCVGGFNTIKNSGLSVPDDISIVGYDGQRIAELIEPRLTTYKQNTEEIGMQAARRLIETIEKPGDVAVNSIVVQGEFVEGSTVGELR